jgi:demethylmenaquinone methyltransferase / 2-methoxy-6-polyprenyl-1,4-benzoquinol methylase
MRSGMAAHKPSLDSAFAGPDAKGRYVRRLFATIADRYDLITVVLSFGRDRSWKRQLVALANLQPGASVLDLACGTGDIAFEAARHGAQVTGVDITLRMLELARKKDLGSLFTKNVKRLPRSFPEKTPEVFFAAGDMCALPIGPATFDAVTTGYGLRNVPDLSRALSEIYRVLRPGGVLCSLDFDKPEAAWFRAIDLGYLTLVGSALGWVLHRDPDTYRYIPASIRRYPGARGVADLMRTIGFVDVRHTPVFGGCLAIHVARKPHRMDR